MTRLHENLKYSIGGTNGTFSDASGSITRSLAVHLPFSARYRLDRSGEAGN